MPTSDVEALRAFVGALNDFVALTKEATDAGKVIVNDDALRDRADGLLRAIWDRRAAALVAGVNNGESRLAMDNFLSQAMSVCASYRGWEQEGQRNTHSRLAGSLSATLGVLNDLIAIAVSHLEVDRPALEVELGLNLTEQAVLAIIKEQPHGHGIQGKAILAKLRAKGIKIKEPTLRSHVLRKLKKHGVVNHPAAGGYLISE